MNMRNVARTYDQAFGPPLGVGASFSSSESSLTVCSSVVFAASLASHSVFYSITSLLSSISISVLCGAISCSKMAVFVDIVTRGKGERS